MCNQKNIIDKADSSYKVLKSALEWVTTSSESEVSDNPRLLKNLRAGIYQVHRLAVTAKAKMCVGVYGPSQSGKSYLVSAIAKEPKKPLIALFGEREVDFIKTINPEGGKESTGVVTRFTIDRFTSPIGFPIKLKLLTELDLTKIFVNSYVNDILQNEDDDLQKHHDEVEKILTSLNDMQYESSTFSIEDVWDLEEYCNTRYSKNLRIQALKRIGFWSRAAELLPALGQRGRLILLEALWEKSPSYSNLYSYLVSELARLGNESELFGAENSLFSFENGQLKRSDASIINVSTLASLKKQDLQQLNVSLLNAKVVAISASALCALTSEIVISMRDKPHEMFERADLLDFPGARSRKGYPKDDNFLSQPNVQIDNFLRGKVAYLFDKYSSDLELTVMVLCIGPSNLEVVGLDSMIEDWIIKTHGEKPSERGTLRTSLFLTLTKFDQEFDQGAGRTLDGTRWSTRLQASLLDPFGSHSHRTNWVKKWTTLNDFNNTFWLRNPNADQSSIMKYEGIPGSSREIDFTEQKREVISTLRTSFINNELVNRHFLNPEIAWDSAMTLNDGGASYLRQQLNETCSDNLKLNQVNQRLNRILSGLQAELGKYFISSDLGKLQEEKLLLAKKITASFAVKVEKHRLGEFIRNLIVSDIDTVNIFKRILLEFEYEKHAKQPVNSQISPITHQIDPNLATELGLELELDPANSNHIEDHSLRSAQLTFPQVFVKHFMDEWRDRCIFRFCSRNISDYLLTDREFILPLISELETAAERTGLIDYLTKYVTHSNQFLADDRRTWIWRQTCVVTARFNDFITHGGIFSTTNTPTTIANLKNVETIVFNEPQELLTDPEISEMQSNFSLPYLKDWIQSIQHTIRANAPYQAGITTNIEKNEQLGTTLEALQNLLKLGSTDNAI